MPQKLAVSGNCEEELPKKPVGRLSVNCRPTGYRQSADKRPTNGRQTADSRPTGFLGSSSSQLPSLFFRGLLSIITCILFSLLFNSRCHLRNQQHQLNKIYSVLYVFHISHVQYLFTVILKNCETINLYVIGNTLL